MTHFRSFGLFACIVLLIFSCTKIDTTKIGSDLIPVVDNVNTFDTLLDVISNNFLFDDSTRLSKNELHTVGSINNDPLFGTTKADLYLEMKPIAFPNSFYTKDSLVGLDSVILSLSFKGVYGDSTAPIDFSVWKVTETMNADTVGTLPAMYKLNKTFATSTQLGTKSYRELLMIADSLPIYRGTKLKYRTANQVRIPLSMSELTKIFSDTIPLKSDSLFKTIFKGFKIQANVTSNPGALCYFDLRDTTTRLEFYYRKKNGIGGIDTTSGSFFCGTTAAHSNNVTRVRTGAEITDHLAALPGGDSLLYIHTNPGSYVRIQIPGLQLLSNRMVHRAELKVIQIADMPLSNRLTPPSYLYLDRFDTARERIKFKAIPFDLNPGSDYRQSCFPSGGIDYSHFGGLPKAKMINGQISYQYTFNLSRYVQSIVTKQEFVNEFRLSSSMFAEYFDCFGVSYIPVTGNKVAQGRIKLGGGTRPGSAWPYKMQLRIIYSKI